MPGLTPTVPYKKKGDNVAAKEQLTKAIDLFKECSADGWIKMTEEKLARLIWATVHAWG
jgi:hypothetical protein